MSISRGKILRVENADADANATTLADESATCGADASGDLQGVRRGRILRQELAAAQAEASALVAKAEQRAAALIADAERAAAERRADAERDGREAGAAQFTAKVVQLSQLEAKSDERGLDRTLALARLLAERLLGGELEQRPERIVEVAKAALTELRAAQQIVIVCNPNDAPPLRDALEKLAVAEQCIDVRADETRAVGCLRLETELGVLDGELGPRLDRLVRELSEELRR